MHHHNRGLVSDKRPEKRTHWLYTHGMRFGRRIPFKLHQCGWECGRVCCSDRWGHRTSGQEHRIFRCQWPDEMPPVSWVLKKAKRRTCTTPTHESFSDKGRLQWQNFSSNDILTCPTAFNRSALLLCITFIHGNWDGTPLGLEFTLHGTQIGQQCEEGSSKVTRLKIKLGKFSPGHPHCYHSSKALSDKVQLKNVLWPAQVFWACQFQKQQ